MTNRIWTSNQGSDTAVAFKSDQQEVLLFSNLGFWMTVHMDVIPGETAEQSAERLAERYGLVEVLQD